MTDAELEQMNAQHALMLDALQDVIVRCCTQYPDVPHPVQVTALLDIAVAQAMAAGMPLDLIQQRTAIAYQQAPRNRKPST